MAKGNAKEVWFTDEQQDGSGRVTGLSRGSNGIECAGANAAVVLDKAKFPVAVLRESANQEPPFASVVVPCLNEGKFIGRVLAALENQYDNSRYEIIVVDGMSDDSTRDVVKEFIASHSHVSICLLDNPARNIPAALNIGIQKARGNIILRMDAHAFPSENYIRRCVELLNDPSLSVVGMPCKILPAVDTLTARANALAVAHPFGIGDAKYRLPEPASQFVDTVPFGAFRKSLWAEIGGFNEDLLTNEDYEFYYRVRRAGGRIFLDTASYCSYFARSTIKDLARQYARYGGWKAQMLKRHPRSAKLRHLAAPTFVASVALLGLMSLWTTLDLVVLLPIVCTYLLLSLFFAYRLSKRSADLKLMLVLPLAFLVIHGAWGLSFLVGLVRSPHRRREGATA